MPTQSSSSASPRSSSRLAKIKCSFCGNTFHSVPSEAVCQKCNRPANKPLPQAQRIVSLLVPPFGIVYSVMIRSHSPVAANQGLVWSLVGCVLYIVLFGARHLF